MPTVVNWRKARPVVSHQSAIVWNCLQPKPADGSDAIHSRPQTTYHLTNSEETRLTYRIIAAR